jgi:3-deoxy-D-arabino-heptulosonate 7-phosphate (DAHP) synthase class II
MKTIQFEHEGQCLTAEVFYDSAGTTNRVRVILNAGTSNLKKVIHFTKQNNEWITYDQLKKKQTESTKLISAVNKCINENLLFDHFLLIGNFCS